MTKRLLILAVLAGAMASSTGAHAACGGSRNIANVKTSGGIEITIVARLVTACDNGSVATPGPLGAPTTLTAKVGTTTCTAQVTSAWDPFGFGAGVHGYAGPDGTSGNADDAWSQTDCNIDMSWSGFLSPYLPAIDRTDGAFLGKDAVVENGKLIVNGTLYELSGAGRMWTGVGGEL